MRVFKEFRFEAAHRLTSSDAGVCSALHGHSYRVVVGVEGSQNPRTQMVINFKDLGWIQELLDKEFDHGVVLNQSDPAYAVLHQLSRTDVPFKCYLMEGEPTAENMASWVLKALREHYSPEYGFAYLVQVWETVKAYAEVTSTNWGAR